MHFSAEVPRDISALLPKCTSAPPQKFETLRHQTHVLGPKCPYTKLMIINPNST